MKTIAQQLNVTEFPFEIKDKNGNLTYVENSNGYWYKKEFDSNGNEIYYEDSNGYWCKSCLLYTSPSPRDGLLSRMPSSA